LARQDKLEAVVQGTEFENLSFVSMGPMPPNPTELLSGTTLGEVIGTAVDQYDIVLIDGPPVLGLADSILYATAVEGTIYVVEAGRANQGQTKAALRRLHASGARIIGAVLTKFNPRHAGYGHEYSYYYSYGSPTEKTSPALES
jgi:succinoglycan biosynthesis transport protein ExoP